MNILYYTSFVYVYKFLVLVTLTVAIVIGASMLTATTPVYFEMACENTYPVAEGITNFVLTLVNNIISVVFLAVQMIPGVGTLNSIEYSRNYL